jgi:hypothetical protein
MLSITAPDRRVDQPFGPAGRSERTGPTEGSDASPRVAATGVSDGDGSLLRVGIVDDRSQGAPTA